MRQAGTYSGILNGGLSGRNGNHSLPLARIKKIMKKSSDDVKMISGEAPIVFSKACELFIEELTQRSWMVTMHGKRRTLHKDDVASAVFATDVFDFLANLVSSNNSSSAITSTTTPSSSTSTNNNASIDDQNSSLVDIEIGARP